MPVSAVYPNFSVKNYKQNFYANPVIDNSIRSQNNTLEDFNYGKSLINSQKISFKGVNPAYVADLSKKVSVVFKSLMHNHVLLIGSDFKTSFTHLSKSIDEHGSIFENLPITKINFVKDTRFDGTVAITRFGDGFDTITSISDSNVFIQYSGSKEVVLLEKGKGFRLSQDELIYTKSPADGFKINFDETDGYSALPDNAVEKFDWSAKVTKQINKLNKENIGDLTKEEVIKTNSQVQFKDIGGQAVVIEKVKKEILYPLKYPNFHNKYFQNSRTVMFLGPPGTGKTLTAKALANESGINYVEINAQLLDSMWKSESAHNIHNFFDEVKKKQPCIVFLDEADAIFPKRQGVHQNDDKDVNMYLKEISQLVEENANVYLVIATNKPHLMDNAILSRFPTQIEFSNFDNPQRYKEVLDIHIKDLNVKDFDSNAFVERLSREKLDGREIVEMIEESKINSIERHGLYETMENNAFADDLNYELIISSEDLNKALDKAVEKKKLVLKYEEEAKTVRAKLIREDHETRHQVEAELEKSPENFERIKDSYKKSIRAKEEAEKEILAENEGKPKDKFLN